MSKFLSIPVDKIEFTSVGNGDFTKIKIYAISNKVNNNNSNFLVNGMRKAIKTFYNKPILAYYNKAKGDVEEHNVELEISNGGEIIYDYQNATSERPCGVIPESANISIERVDKKYWIVIDSALIWDEYNHQLSELIKKQKKKKVSVEIEVLKSKVDDSGVNLIQEFKLLGITILGDDIGEGIENAHLELQKFSSSNSFKLYREKFSKALNSSNDDIIKKYSEDNGTNKKRSNFAMTYNNLSQKISLFLSEYKYSDKDYSYYKYYLEDIYIDEEKFVVYDCQYQKYYFIYYEIVDEDVVIDINNKIEVKKGYIEKFSKDDFKIELYFDDEYGTGEEIQVDKSKDSISNDSWSDINKTSLRHTVLEAENYKSLVKDVYLLVEDGWEDSPTEHLKYPVMQYKDGVFVYNSNGLLSAQQYGDKNDKSIVDKVKEIREKFGLVKSEKRDSMSKFVELAKEAGYNLIATFAEKCIFVKDSHDESFAELKVYFADKEICETNDSFKEEDFEEKSLKMNDDDDEDGEKDKGTDESEVAKENKNLKEELSNVKEELNKFKKEKFVKETDNILLSNGVSEELAKELKKMRDDNKFSSVEDFEKEMSYKLFKENKNNEDQSKDDKLSFGLFTKTEKNKNVNKPKNIYEELDSI